MTQDVLEQVIRNYMCTDQPRYVFAWQGGEPALMGVDFYRRVVELQETYAPEGAVVINALQTNATLIDEEMARHLSDHKFLVGISLDGPAYLHDRYRRSAGGAGSFKEVMRGIQRLREKNAAMNVITVVTDIQVRKAKEVYRFLCDQYFDYHQYIPCVEFSEDGNLEPFAIKGEEWGDFLCELYDEWSKWDIQRVSIRLFDSIIARLVDGSCTVCDMDSDCRHYFVVESNGDVYPCDFYVRPELRLGNVLSGSWEQMWRSPIYADFGARKAMWQELCNQCEFLRFCLGDCPRRRTCGSGNTGGVSRLCSGYRQFYRHALPSLQVIAERIRQRSCSHKSESGVPSSWGKTGRNAPCPCGSGLKYKRCCGR